MSDILIGNESDWLCASDLIDIVEYLGGSEPSEEDIWAIAREYEDPPTMVNLWYREILVEIINLLMDRGIEEERLSYFVNASDTHLYLDNEEIYDLCELKEALQ